jgi:chromosome segregation ATPase
MEVEALLRGADGCAIPLPPIRLKSKTSIRKAAAAIVRSAAASSASAVAEVAILKPTKTDVAVHTFSVGARGGIKAGKPRISHAATVSAAAANFNTCRTAAEDDDDAAAAAADIDNDPDRIGREPPRRRPASGPVHRPNRRQAAIPASSSPYYGLFGTSAASATASMLQKRVRDMESSVTTLQTDLANCRQRNEPAALIARGIVSRQTSAAEIDLRKRLSAAESALVLARQQFDDFRSKTAVDQKAAADRQKANEMAYRQKIDAELAAAAKRAEDRLADLKTANDDRIRSINDAKAAAESKLQAAKTDVDQSLSACQTDSAERRNRFLRLEKANADEINRLRPLLESATAQIAKLKAEDSAELLEYTALNDECVAENKRQSEELRSLRKQLTDTKESNAAATARLTDVKQKQLNELESKLSSNQQELAKYKSAADRYVQQIQDADRRIVQIQQQSADAELKKNNEIKAIAEQYANENKRLQAEQSKQQAEFDRRTADQARRQLDICTAQTQAKLDTLDASFQPQRDRLALLESELKAAKAENTALYAHAVASVEAINAEQRKTAAYNADRPNALARLDRQVDRCSKLDPETMTAEERKDCATYLAVIESSSRTGGGGSPLSSSARFRPRCAGAGAANNATTKRFYSE